MRLFRFPERVNEVAARLVAGAVVVLACASIHSSSPWLTAALAGGFLLRVGWGPALSPLARAAVWLAPRLAQPRLVPGRPKRFAQAIGAVVTVSATALGALELAGASRVLLSTLVIFALLESVFGFCFGCWLFAHMQRRGWISADACVTCVGEPGVTDLPRTS